ncbi:MAG: nucleoside monophosphate kinase [Patescibacteria group bacterium]
MIIIFIGPPFAGKDTQAKLLSKEINLPVYSMGALIREAYEKGDPKAIEGFENYSMKGLHLPISLKFHLVKDKIDSLKEGLIIDNFPATREDLDAFNEYLSVKGIEVKKAFYINISNEEMIGRITHRGRGDDDPDIVMKRRENQDKDREAVINFYKNKGLLVEIDGARPIEDVHKEIMEEMNK